MIALAVSLAGFASTVVSLVAAIACGVRLDRVWNRREELHSWYGPDYERLTLAVDQAERKLNRWVWVLFISLGLTQLARVLQGFGL